MNMQIRIAAKDDFASLFALSRSGGKFVDGAYPKFVFQNQAQRDQYDQIRREMGAKVDGAAHQESTGKAKAARRGYRKRLSRIGD